MWQNAARRCCRVDRHPRCASRRGAARKAASTDAPPCRRAGWRGQVRKIVGGHRQSTDATPRFQARISTLPLRSRGPVQFYTTPAGLDRLADHALHLGRHAEAERLAFLAAELRQAVQP